MTVKIPKYCLVKFIVIIIALSSLGCPPKRTSLLVNSKTDYDNADAIMYNEKYYAIKNIYPLNDINNRITDKDISSVKLALTSGEKIGCDSITFTDSSVLLFNKNENKNVQLSQVEKVILYERIPFNERRDGFLVQLIPWTLIGAVPLSDNKFSIERTGAFALVGVGLGSLFLFDKQRVKETVLNIYNQDKDYKIEILEYN